MSGVLREDDRVELVDVPGRSISVHRRARAGGYEQISRYADGDRVPHRWAPPTSP